MAAVVGFCLVGLGAFVLYEARLSKEGRILKEDWLGFKLYLETAEKGRMQNLTPETFEKFLPYAIVFGVENKWMKAFNVVRITPSGSAVKDSFSPAEFSDAFVSSLGKER